MIPIPNAITAAAAQYGVPASLALAVAHQESGMNQSAVSSKGAIGIFQLMPATAAQLGVDPTDAQQNIVGGVRYLAMLLGEFSDPVAAVAAYNWGPTAVSRAIAQYGPTWLATAPAETQGYVENILGVSAAAEAANLQPAPADLPPAVAAPMEAGFVPTSAPAGFGAAVTWLAVLVGGALVFGMARGS